MRETRSRSHRVSIGRGQDFERENICKWFQSFLLMAGIEFVSTALDVVHATSKTLRMSAVDADTTRSAGTSTSV